MKINPAKSEKEIAACFPVMHELRPHLNLASFLTAVERMKGQGYNLVCLADPEICSVAGYRKIEMLAMGTVLYVDDLVTLKSHRSKGYGAKLLAWLLAEAKKLNCQYLELDSGVKRTDAHRFYEKNGLKKAAFHFSIPARAAAAWSAEP